MDNQEQRDYAEEQYNRDLCPECDYSPCIGPKECKEGRWKENPQKYPTPSIETGKVIGYFDAYSGQIVLDGGEWWRSVS